MAKQPVIDRKDKAATYAAGGVIGFLVALLLLGLGVQMGYLFPEAGPLVQVRIIKKNVTRNVNVVVNNSVEKLYRVTVSDADGNVTQTFDNISKFEFRIIGAILTPTEGEPFNVDGHIAVEQIR